MSLNKLFTDEQLDVAFNLSKELAALGHDTSLSCGFGGIFFKVSIPEKNVPEDVLAADADREAWTVSYQLHVRTLQNGNLFLEANKNLSNNGIEWNEEIDSFFDQFSFGIPKDEIGGMEVPPSELRRVVMACL